MKFLMTLALVLAPTLSFAADTCENYAKYFAIRDYKSAGPVQGSDGIQYDSELISVIQLPDGDEYLYKVIVNDNNEDGEYWSVSYGVLAKHNKTTNKCSLLKLNSAHSED